MSYNLNQYISMIGDTERANFVAYIDVLPDREQRIAIGSIQGVPGSVLAQREGVSRSRISQILREIVETYRQWKEEKFSENPLDTSPDL